MMVIGIVGGIASGKSAVAKCFQDLGATVLDADRIGHEVLRLESVKREIREHWGESVFNSRGEVDRAAMAKTVFGMDSASRQRLARLEQITHPLIAERMRGAMDEMRRTQATPAVILDAPVLVKAGWNRLCDKIVFVDVDAATRRQRVLGRGWSEDEWRRREALQTPLERLRPLADVVIDNSVPLGEMARQIAKIWRDWGLPTR